MRRGLIALLLAFGWLFSTPAHATPLVTGDTVQFSYTWGSVTREITDSVVTVTVVNDITNKIGGNGEVIDTYRITFANQVIEVTEKHGPRDYTFMGSGTLTLEGIDRGFWAGYYGPIMTVSVSPLALPEEPTTQSPQTESPTQSEATQAPSIIWDYSIDEGGVLTAEAPAGQVFSNVVARYVAHEGDCGLDVSEIVGAVLIGSSSGTIPATNESFGDPCPGWYKKLIVSVGYSNLMLPSTESPTAAESATLSPAPEVQPTPQPSPEPSPSPEPIQPEPTPEPTPLETPTASSPTQSPEPEPTESPIAEEEPEPASESLAPTTPPAPQTKSPEPQLSPIIEPSPVQSSEVIIEEPTTTTPEVTQVPEETFSESVSSAIETAVTEAIGAVGEAVGQLVEAFASAGLDMTPEQREEAQDLVVSTVITSQVAVGIRKIK